MQAENLIYQTTSPFDEDHFSWIIEKRNKDSVTTNTFNIFRCIHYDSNCLSQIIINL